MLIPMKSTFYFSAILVLLLSACNGASTGTADAPVTTTQLDSEVHKSVAKIFIGGMTCKAGCGGKIEQELKSLAGVKTTETIFDENKTENMVSVEFDPATIDPKGMEACVEKIMDGKYVVTRIEVLNYRGLQSHGTGGADVETKDMGFSELFKLLNVFQSLGRLLTSDM
jgi:copper chaperone CopZ